MAATVQIIEKNGAAATGDRIAATNIARPPATGGRRPTH